MAKKTSTAGITLETLIQELTQTVEELKKRSVRIGNSLVRVGDPSFLKTKQKLKDGEVYFTLSFKAPLEKQGTILSTRQREAPRLAGQQKPSPPRDIKQPKQGTPPGGKKLKKEVSRLWKVAAKLITEGRAPSRAETGRLVKQCEAYSMHADSSWAADWQTCCATVKQCLDAASAGDLVKARGLIDEVNRLTKACHKKYK